MPDSVRFALVGAGAIAQTYAQAMRQVPEARLVAVVDPRLDAARALAETVDCPSFATHREFLEEGPVCDAAVVCTPPSTHEEISVDVLNKGLHVLCEKPFALDVAGAIRMSDAAIEAGVLLSMGSKFRYVDDVVRAKSIVDSGILGEIILFENVFTSRVDMSKRWNSDPAISGGGVLIDNGSHSVDLMRYFLGPLSAVQAVEGKRSLGLRVEDTALVFARSESGEMGRLDLSWSIHKESENYLSIHGRHGTIFVGWKQSRYRQSSSPDWVIFGSGYDKVRAFSNQVRNFARSIQGREILRITAEDAVASVEVIETAYRSMVTEHWVSVEHESASTCGNGVHSQLGPV